MKIAACLIVRNESAIIREWLACYDVMGFDSCIVFDHGSIDDTLALIEIQSRYQDIIVVPLRTDRGMGALRAQTQCSCYDAACAMFGGKFDWIGVFDADEILYVHDTAGVRAMLRRMPDEVAQVCIPWAMFGSNGHVIKPPGLMIENFQRRAPHTFDPNLMGKSIVKPYRVKYWPNPHAAWVDGESVTADGKPVHWWPDIPGRFANFPGYEQAQVNHYFTRSWEHWLRRIEDESDFHKEGSLNRRTKEMFEKYDRNEIIDALAAERYGERVRKHLEDHAPSFLRRHKEHAA